MPRLKIKAIPLLPLSAFMASSGVDLIFTETEYKWVYRFVFGLHRVLFV
jgi:hypothetical protein